MEDLIEVLAPGLYRIVGCPAYGRQDLGYSPGGAIDLFSYYTGNIMLDNPGSAQALELIQALEMRFVTDCWFVITGAGYAGTILSWSDRQITVEHGVVYAARAGSVLSCGRRTYGLRSYLCLRRISDQDPRLAGRRRGPFTEIAHWPDEEGRIRIMPGPEYKVLASPREFSSAEWTCSAAMDNMAIRLIGKPVRTTDMPGSMISAPVGDGTIQLTPNGPIILLRDRQTCGGYPRIFNVISSDINLLGQYRPFQKMHFRVVCVADARRVVRQLEQDIHTLKDRFL